MELAGEALFDATGRFTGFRGIANPAGKAEAAVAPAATLSDPAFGSLPRSDPAFGRRNDGALRGPLRRCIRTVAPSTRSHDGPLRADYRSTAQRGWTRRSRTEQFWGR